MRVVLWDTHWGGVFKDFAGGYGVGTFRGDCLRTRLLERMYTRDFRPVALAYAYLTAGLRRQGHTIQYALEETPKGDIYIFMPALMTVGHEHGVIRQINERFPSTRVLVLGTAASTLPEAFADLDCQVLTGEPEQLLRRFDEVLASTDQRIDLGTVKNLDDLPIPDWTAFPYSKFSVSYDFWKFPTAYVQSSRGCTLSCNYCPYIILENKVRLRSPAAVAEELAWGHKRCGFQSFKFRDPLFAVKKKHVEEIAERIGKLPRKIQFSVESRIELLPRETLKMLKDVGLTSITVGIETPSRATLLKYKRAPIRDDKQDQFVGMCRELGIRVIAGFMIGFPEDTPESIRHVLSYAKKVNPYAANFNIVTPYPGTGFFKEIRDQIDTFDWSRFDVYTPNLKYDNLSAEEVSAYHRKCFRQYYFRWGWLTDNWKLLWPRLHRWFAPLLPAKDKPPVAPVQKPAAVPRRRRAA